MRASDGGKARLVVSAALLCALTLGCAGPPMRTGSDARTLRIISHEVAAGESLESIADDFYGDRRAASYLREVNDIPEGMSLDRGSMLDVPVGKEDMERYERRTRAKVHYNRGTILADHGDLERAAEEFRSALRVDPLFADAGHNLGVVLLGTGETGRAVSIFRQAAELRPRDPDYAYALGAALLEAGRPSEALEELERTLMLAPGHEDARFSRALALLDVGRVQEAVFHLDAYIRDYPRGRWAALARSKLEELATDGAGGGGEVGP